MPWASDEAADIHAALAETVTYNGAGLTNAPIAAVKSDVPADDFSGSGRTLRQVSFEVRQSALPQAPAKGNTIVHDAKSWKVNDITRRDDIGGWLLIVEEV